MSEFAPTFAFVRTICVYDFLSGKSTRRPAHCAPQSSETRTSTLPLSSLISIESCRPFIMFGAISSSLLLLLLPKLLLVSGQLFSSAAASVRKRNFTGHSNRLLGALCIRFGRRRDN